MKKLICYLMLLLGAALSSPALADEDNPFAAPRFLVAEFKKFMSDMVGERFMCRLPVSVGKQQGLPAGALTDNKLAARAFCVAIEKKPGTACGFQS